MVYLPQERFGHITGRDVLCWGFQNEVESAWSSMGPFSPAALRLLSHRPWRGSRLSVSPLCSPVCAAASVHPGFQTFVQPSFMWFFGLLTLLFSSKSSLATGREEGTPTYSGATLNQRLSFCRVQRKMWAPSNHRQWGHHHIPITGLRSGLISGVSMPGLL